MKVCLITPYGGTNLGDAAIQEAVIHNIRRRYPEADIRLVTLSPEKTSQLHGLVSFPLTAFAIEHYSSGILPENKDICAGVNESKSQEPGILDSFKNSLRNLPYLFSVLKRLHGSLWRAAKLTKLMRMEVNHFIQSSKFVKGSDLLLVSGGGQLDDYWGGPWGHPYSLLKWGFIARIIGARYVFLGVGTCALDSWLSTFFIRQALRLAAYRSYRDQTSKKLLEEMAFTHGDLVGPDLAFSFEKTRLASKCVSVGSGRTIGISPITYLRHNWPKKNKEVYESYLTNLVFFISELIQRGYSILLYTTNKSDRHAIEEIVDLLSQGGNSNIEGKLFQACTDTLDELFPALEKVDCLVASRLHGVILGHLMQKPVLAISYDRKVDTYMKDTGFQEYCRDINDVKADSLIKAFETMIADEKKIGSKLDEMGTAYARLLDSQYNLVLER